MKESILLIAIMLLCGISNAQTEKRDTAVVAKVRGIPVFMMCEPTAPYEVTNIIFTVYNKLTYEVTISKMCDELVADAQRLQKKNKVSFDAIIINDKWNGQADRQAAALIKFK